MLDKDYNSTKSLKIGITKEERHSVSNGFCIYMHDKLDIVYFNMATSKLISSVNNFISQTRCELFE